MAENLTIAELEPRLSLADWRHAERFFEVRRESLVPVREPMVLISQIQRSGGTLLNSLLDGHPQLHVHPWEVQIGYPTKSEWPPLDPDAGVDAWLEMLRQDWLARAFEAGYRKDRPGEPLAEGVLPAAIVPSYVERLFRVLVSRNPPETPRDIVDAYFTAFFNAWIDCQGLWDAAKRWVVGFCPRLAWGDGREHWWNDYPDGRIVAVVRDPRGWYASARSYDRRYEDLDHALVQWRRGTNEIARAKRERPEQVHVLTYELLVGEPEPALRALAAWLEIDWSRSLLMPTFNRMPVRPDSSFDLPMGGIRKESLERWRTELDRAEQEAIEERFLPAYRSVAELAASADGATAGSAR